MQPPRPRTAMQADGLPSGVHTEMHGRSDATLDPYRAVRVCIWIYFWLLILEGALRKWILPDLANPLILVKDPVVLVAYIFALKSGRMPWNRFVLGITFLGGVTFAVAIIGFTTGYTRGNFLVAGYGARTNFFYFPFIFLIADALRPEDLKKMCRWLLILSLPIAVLVLGQFRAGPESWLNKGTGEGLGGQMQAAVGEYTRAAGIFSYNTGLATFLSLAAAFLVDHFLRGKVHGRTLALAAAFAVAGSALLSASRTTTLSVVLVAVAGAFCVWLQPKFFKGSLWMVLAAFSIVLVFASSRTIRQGLWVLGERFEMTEGIKVGIFDRVLSTINDTFDTLGTHGWMGNGLGVGTNAGAALLTGKRDFLLAESEWERILSEVGPVLGLAFILFRILLVWHLFRRALAALRRGEPLAMLLLGMCAPLILSGQLGAAQTLGFATCGAGLCLAAAKEREETDVVVEELPSGTVKIPKLRGRSPYAEQLHGTPGTS